jgi:hypothetical protein
MPSVDIGTGGGQNSGWSPIVSAIIGAGASLAGGAIASRGASSGANAITAASTQALGQQQAQYTQNRTDILPWITSGGAALGRLNYLLGLAPGGTSAGAFSANYGPQGAAPGGQPATGTRQISGEGEGTIRSDTNFRDWFGQGEGTIRSDTNFRDWFGQGSPMPPGVNPISSDELGMRFTGIAPGEGPRKPSPSFLGNSTFDSPPAGASQGAAPAPTGAGDAQFGSLMRDFGVQDFNVDPGYLFRLQEGQKALDRSAAASGNLFSGGTLKASQRYNQDFASNEYGNAYNRYQNNRQTRYNMLSGVAGLGSQNAQTLAGLGTNASNVSASNMIQAANDAARLRASGYGALGTGIGGALSNLSGLAAYYSRPQIITG